MDEDYEPSEDSDEEEDDDLIEEDDDLIEEEDDDLIEEDEEDDLIEEEDELEDDLNEDLQPKTKRPKVTIINFHFPETSKKKNIEVSTPDIVEDAFGPNYFTEKYPITLKFNRLFENIGEMILLGEKYDPSIDYICNIDIRKLHNMVEPLKELNNMIGLEHFKKSIMDQILYILTEPKTKLLLHTCIYGESGCGKTEIAKILCKIYASSGVLSSDKFKVVKREDLVGEYLGQTAIKTKELLNSMKGGVLFLDEAYSMGSTEKRDHFAKEAIDTLNVFLSENYHDFVMIIAGYEKDVNEFFFSQNKGLDRRFPYRFHIDKYSPEELSKIFQKFLRDEGLFLEDMNIDNFFIQNKEYFKFFGGDVKILLDQIKVTHSRKKMLLDKSMWNTITKADIEEGFKIYLEGRKQEENPYLQMYI